LLSTGVQHEPWPLAEATIGELRETLTTAAGLPPPQTAPLGHYSTGGHDVRLAAAKPVGLSSPR
jgi:uncharacterized protein YqjF (DUF2071 family)